MSTPTKPPPEFKFTHDLSLEPYNKTMRQWLFDNDKHWDGLTTGALVFNPQNKILLVQRAATDSMPNKWEIPGGSVDEEDPSLLHACARELWEEAGLVAARFKHPVRDTPGGDDLGSVFTNRHGTRIYSRFSFEVEVEDWECLKLDPAEHQDYLWVTEDEARAGRVGDREIVITSRRMRSFILEGFRLRLGNEARPLDSKDRQTAARTEPPGANGGR
jgi:8-oxo-dGTP pyrophosphatase MutT (NUDIX family)